MRAQRTADHQSPELATYLADPQLTETVAMLYRLEDSGWVQVYDTPPTFDPKVIAVRLDAVPPTVVLEDCFDTSSVRLVKVADRSTVPLRTDRVTRYLVRTTVANYDGRWLVNTDEPVRERPC